MCTSNLHILQVTHLYPSYLSLLWEHTLYLPTTTKYEAACVNSKHMTYDSHCNLQSLWRAHLSYVTCFGSWSITLTSKIFWVLIVLGKQRPDYNLLNPFMPVPSKNMLILVVSLWSEHFSKNIWMSNVDRDPTHNSPLQNLWISDWLQIFSTSNYEYVFRWCLCDRYPSVNGLILNQLLKKKDVKLV